MLQSAELRMLRRGKDAGSTLVVIRYPEKGGTDTLEPVTIAKQFHADFAAQSSIISFSHAEIIHCTMPGARMQNHMLAVTNTHLT